MNIIAPPKPKKDLLRQFPVLQKHTSDVVFNSSGLQDINVSEGESEYILTINANVSAIARFQLHEGIEWTHAHIRAEIHKGSTLIALFDVQGGKRITISLQCDMVGEGGETDIRAVFHGEGKSHHSMHLVMHHIVKNTKGSIAIRGVYEQDARAVFSGLIKIEKQAQKTQSYFRDDVLLLDHAIAESLPTLEIEANDVKASHGSTTSRLNEEQLFYMQSRGISAFDARRLIVKGFLGKIPPE